LAPTSWEKSTQLIKKAFVAAAMVISAAAMVWGVAAHQLASTGPTALPQAPDSGDLCDTDWWRVHLAQSLQA
jgi:hypothetical protein